MKIYESSFRILEEEAVEPQDILDAVETVSPKNKLEIELPFPGNGPHFFLRWAKEELDEALALDSQDSKNRKFYNASIYSKGSVECLVDWYLSKYLLQNTISPKAGLLKKLEALDSQNLLGISFPLFNSVVFEPRNRGIHRFELIEEVEAIRGYELANLTIKNCVNSVSPSIAPIFYGQLEFYEGREALEKMLKVNSNNMDAFYFSGIGDEGSVSILIDRQTDKGKISVLTSLGEDKVESRFCNIGGKFTPKQLRLIFEKLEKSKPMAQNFNDTSHLRYILDSLLQKNKENRS
jgi:hypothetical protein